MPKKHRKTKKADTGNKPQKQGKETKIQEPRQQLNLKQKIFSSKNIIAALLEIILWVGGELLGHISPYIKIAAWLIAILILIWLLIPFKSWIEKLLKRNDITVKPKLLTILSISPVLVLAIFLFVFAFQPLVNLETPIKAIEDTTNPTPTHIKQPNTVVYCCLRGNTYQISAQNKGDKEDAVVITLAINTQITSWHPVMGASLPTKIEGGPGGNFIIFKIDELIPDIGLDYIVETWTEAVEPFEFKAWSKEVGDIQAIFWGKCPEVGLPGPEITRPP